MYNSLSTPDYKFGHTMYLVEKIIFSTTKPPPLFWAKTKCDPMVFSLDIYRRTQILIQALRNVNKFYKDEILVAAVSGFNQKQLKKIYALAIGAYNMGKIIQGFRFYCDNESAREKRIEAPKDETEVVTPLVFEVGKDLRSNKERKKKPILWSILKEHNGKEEV